MAKAIFFYLLLVIQIFAIAVVECNLQLKWTTVEEDEKAKIVKAIVDTKVLKETRTEDLMGILDPEHEHQIRNEDKMMGTLVVCRYLQQHFFCSINAKDGNYRVTRFGRFRDSIGSNENNTTICQEEAEFYRYWNPYAFKEKWEVVDSGEHNNVYENKNVLLSADYILLRRWFLPNGKNHLAIYLVGSKYVFLAQTYFNDEEKLSNIKHYGKQFDHQWEVEEELTAYLVTMHPFLGDRFRELQEISTEFRTSIDSNLQEFTKKLETHWDKKDKWSIVSMLPVEEDGDKCLIFFSSDTLGENQLRRYMLVGAEELTTNDSKLVLMIQMEEGVVNPMDIVERYCIIAFSTHFKDPEEDWQWKWDMKNHKYFSGVTHLIDKFDKRVIRAAPFTPENNKVFFQKIRHLDANNMIAIYSCLGKLFLVAFGDDKNNQNSINQIQNSNTEKKEFVNIKHVGALGNEEELLQDYNRYINSSFAFKESVFQNGMEILKLSLPEEVKTNLVKIFAVIKDSSKLIAEAWTSIDWNNSEDWILECNYIPAPHYRTTAQVTWFAILCKVNITEELRNMNSEDSKFTKPGTNYVYTVVTFHDKVYHATYMRAGYVLYSTIGEARAFLQWSHIRPLHDEVYLKSMLQFTPTVVQQQ